MSSSPAPKIPPQPEAATANSANAEKVGTSPQLVDPNKASAPPVDAPPPVPEKRPVTVVFAIEKGLNVQQVEKQFKDEHMRLVFAKTEEDIIKEVSDPACFTVFMSIDFAKNGIRIMQRCQGSTRTYFIMISGHLSTQRRTALLQAGAKDILNHPVSAPQFKLRARAFLGRHLKAHDMPLEVELPPGFYRREETQSSARSTSSETGGDKDKAPMGIVRGKYEENQGREYNYVKGDKGSEKSAGEGLDRNGQQKSGPENRIHDLSLEAAEKEKALRISRDPQAASKWRTHEGSEDPQVEWKHSEGGPNEKPPDWNNHANESAKDLDSGTKRIEGDEAPQGTVLDFKKRDKDPAAAWRNRVSSDDPSDLNPNNIHITDDLEEQLRHEAMQLKSERGKSKTQIIAGDPTNETPHRHHASGESADPLHRNLIGKSEEPAPFRNKIEHDPMTRVREERRRQNETDVNEAAKNFHENPESPEVDPATRTTAASENPPAPPTRNTAFTETISNAPEAVNPELERPLAEILAPHNLLEAIRLKRVLLRSDVAFRSVVWPDVSTFVQGHHHGMEQTLEGLRNLFADTCATLKANRISLLAMRDVLPLSGAPKILHCLVSSDYALAQNESIETRFIPQLRLAWEEGKPFFLNDELPSEIDGAPRPEKWRLDGKNELLSVVIPIMAGPEVSVAVFIQFDHKLDENLEHLLDQCVTFLRVPERQYTLLDFLARVYRGVYLR